MEEIRKGRGVDIHWGERKLCDRLHDCQPGGDRRDNWHESRKKDRVRPHAVRDRNRGPELQAKEEKEEEEKEKREWTNESREKYLDKCRDWTCNGRTVEEMWTEIKKKINEAVPKKQVKIQKWGMGEKAWYDREWKERKREMRRKMTRFRKGKCRREVLIEENRHSDSGVRKERKDTKKKKWRR
ncbi:matrix metalloproteinase-2-like [Bombus huntii]|uniref:matrix metalloproteinase-2-like n=1 Tax=Bombus huntii TaxID=85661 RepID=UPI0021A9C485|nr:matrix metalloproteinase-2-like [Bombus huntii]